MANLPNGYIELEYIESTGTQYIDTGYNPTNNTNFILEADILNSNNTGAIHICSANTSSIYYALRLSDNFSTYQTRYGSGGLQNIESNEFYGRHIFKRVANSISIDDGTPTTSSQQTFISTTTLTIFGLHQNKQVESLCKMKLYNFSIEGVLNYIPCKNPDGEIGVYDTLNKIFKGNDGTGTFIAGPEIIKPNMYVKINNIWQPVLEIRVKTNNTW